VTSGRQRDLPKRERARFLARMTQTRRVLIATPLKGDIPKAYFQTSLQLVSSKLEGIKLDFLMLDGPAVQMARNEIAHYAIENKFDELVFWDKDVMADVDGINQTGGAIVRLLSHNVDIVCGLYSTRSLETHWHIDPLPDEEPNADGLQKVNRSAIGFSKIKTSVFRKISEDNPDRVAYLIDPNRAPKTITELFPMGIQGKNTPEGRIKEIKNILSDAKRKDLKPETVIGLIERTLTIRYDQVNLFASEDYWFCDLARASGFDIHLDTNLIMGHEGRCIFPITTPRLLAVLSEPWRKDELAALKAKIAAEQAAKAK
jgi:hypothetical protein